MASCESETLDNTSRKNRDAAYGIGAAAALLGIVLRIGIGGTDDKRVFGAVQAYHTHISAVVELYSVVESVCLGLAGAGGIYARLHQNHTDVRIGGRFRNGPVRFCLRAVGVAFILRVVIHIKHVLRFIWRPGAIRAGRRRRNPYLVVFVQRRPIVAFGCRGTVQIHVHARNHMFVCRRRRLQQILRRPACRVRVV